jgi:hypothetical protein
VSACGFFPWPFILSDNFGCTIFFKPPGGFSEVRGRQRLPGFSKKIQILPGKKSICHTYSDINIIDLSTIENKFT